MGNGRIRLGIAGTVAAGATAAAGAAGAAPAGGLRALREPPPQVGRFLVEAGGLLVADFQEVGGLAAEVEVTELWEGGSNGAAHKLPGRIKYPNLTLKRGATLDPRFAAWRPSLAGGRLAVERRSVGIVLLDHAGLPVRRWAVRGAYPVKWSGPEFKAGSMEVAIESLELAHDGWSEA